MNSSDLVVGQSVVLVLGHEPFHTEEIQVPRILVVGTGKLTDLDTGGRAASAVALTIGGGAFAADTSDGGETRRLALEELSLDLVDVVLNGSVDVDGTVLVRVVVAAVLEGDRDLQDSEEGNQHGHHALGLAEDGRHGWWLNVCVASNELPKTRQQCARTAGDATTKEARQKTMDAKERGDPGEKAQWSKQEQRRRGLRPRRQDYEESKKRRREGAAGADMAQGHIFKQAVPGPCSIRR